MAHKVIFLVEDDPDIRRNLKEVLELEGYRVVVAVNGREALEVLQAKRPNSHPFRPSIILLDLLMPVMTGWEFLEAQKEDPRIADIPVIALSAAGDKAKTAQAQAFLKKPIEVDYLLTLIEQHARRV